VNSGDISYNIANIGQGVYVADPTAVFTTVPSTTGTFSIADIIYLNNSAYISVGVTPIPASVTFTVQVPTPTVGTVVAQNTAGNFSGNDQNRFAYAGGGHTFSRVPGSLNLMQIFT
jgi:hypothetical protein